jgi:hypothetical protein
MPKVFRDAVFITRKLGFCYLWINALCIIQDSEEDWVREASKMADIFANSFVTIAVASVTNPTESIFRPWKRLRLRLILLDVRMPHKHRLALGNGPLCVLDNRQYSGLAPRPHRPLDSRGWVFQEQILSRRTIIYSNGEIFWDCVSATASEAYLVSNFESERLEDKDIQLFKVKIYAREPITDDASLRRLYISWQYVIGLYTARRLTKPTDKLIVFAGVGTLVEMAFSSVLLHGLLERYLVQELLWALYVASEQLP